MTSSTAIPASNIELARGPRAGHPDAAPGRDAGRDLRPGPRRRRRRHARQDDDDVDADADPRRGRAGAELHRRRRRHGRRHRRPLDRRRAGSSSRPTRATAPTSSCRCTATILLNVELDFLEHYGTFDGLVASFDRYLAQIAGPKVAVRRRPGLRRPGGAPRRRRRTASPRTPTCGPSTCASRRRVVHVRRRAATAAARSGSATVAAAAARRAQRRQRHRRDRHGARARRRRSTPAAAALARFGGVARRFDIRGVDGGATFVDDYGHLPAEIAAVIAAARDSGDGWGRVIVAFQPNRFNRIAEMWRDYADAFVGADVVVITEIYPSGHDADPGRHRQADRQRRRSTPTPTRASCGCRGATTSCRSSPARSARRRVHLDGVRRHRHAARGGPRPAGDAWSGDP